MEPYQLDNFKRWFDAYTDRFCAGDEQVGRRLREKHEHTYRTCEEILLLADAIGLDENQKRVAEVVALFHDVGRFPQFARYRTYNDARSVDHSRLSVEVLREEGVLDVLQREERQWVETAIEQHGRKVIRPDLKGQALLFTKLIRDADKLDIFRILLDRHRQYEADPEGVPIEPGLSMASDYSPQVLDAVVNRQTVAYDDMRTISDMRLLQIGWVYDMNFPASLARLRQRGFLEDLFAYLTQTQEVLDLRDTIREYLDARAPVES